MIKFEINYVRFENCEMVENKRLTPDMAKFDHFDRNGFKPIDVTITNPNTNHSVSGTLTYHNHIFNNYMLQKEVYGASARGYDHHENQMATFYFTCQDNISIIALDDGFNYLYSYFILENMKYEEMFEEYGISMADVLKGKVCFSMILDGFESVNGVVDKMKYCFSKEDDCLDITIFSSPKVENFEGLYKHFGDKNPPELLMLFDDSGQQAINGIKLISNNKN